MKSTKEPEKIINKDEASRIGILNTLASICSSVGRTTIRFFKNLPLKIKNYFRIKYLEYKRKPARKDINRVYILVGYTTKKHIENKFNAERYMIIFRRGLLLLIFVLLLFISINGIIPLINTDQYSQMFGIEDIKEMTKNDPFSNNENTDLQDKIASDDVENVTVTPTPS